MAKSIQLADAFFVEGGDKNAVMRDMSKKPLRFQLPVRLSDGVATDLQSSSKLGFTELLAAVVLSGENLSAQDSCGDIRY